MPTHLPDSYVRDEDWAPYTRGLGLNLLLSVSNGSDSTTKE